MNKKDKEEVAVVKKLIKSIKKGYGANCPELNVDCASCKAQIMISYLEWHMSGLVWSMDNASDKEIKKSINRIRELINPKTNGIKKSKVVGKF